MTLYLDFLKAINHLDVRSVCEQGKNRCYLRHDVDHDISIVTSLKLGRLENSMKMHATYYMLHDTNYFKHKDFFRVCHILMDLGHEIGLHNNIVTRCLKTKEEPRDVLEDLLKTFEENSVPIKTICSHGDKDCREKDYNNYEIFEECNARHRPRIDSIEHVKLHTLKLKDYGLQEAYFVPRDIYINDAWYMYIEGEDEWCYEFNHGSRLTDPLTALRQIKPDITSMILIHPGLLQMRI